MHQEARELKVFLDALAADPCDKATRYALADWYEKHDEPELADEQRQFKVNKYKAEQRLRKFADRYANGDYDGMVAGMLAGHYCFSDDDGPYNATQKGVWDDLKTVTGQDPPYMDNVQFRCAC